MVVLCREKAIVFLQAGPAAGPVLDGSPVLCAKCGLSCSMPLLQQPQARVGVSLAKALSPSLTLVLYLRCTSNVRLKWEAS